MSNGRDCQCGQAHRACNTEFQYAAKVVCGTAVAGPAGPAAMPVAPGHYRTAINIHNPSKCEVARFRWKVAVGNPGAPGPISPYQTLREGLGPDMGFEIDCPQIRNAFPPPGPTFVKGYVVIESDIELDVVAVYSTAQTITAAVNSFHTERVQSRCVPVCEDLVLPLHTGVAGWQTVASSVGGPLGPVALPIPPGGFGVPPPFGSSWVSQTINDWQPTTSPGQRTYELRFDLCYGFTAAPAIQIEIQVDDTAAVRLNNSPVLTVPFGVLTPLTINPAFLIAGVNRLRVAVTNTGGNTMFGLAGLLRVARGKCPCSPLPLVPFGRVVVGTAGEIGDIQGGQLEASASREVAPREATTKRPARKTAAKKKKAAKSKE